MFNFASKANVRAALHRSLYWSKSLVIGMTEATNGMDEVLNRITNLAYKKLVIDCKELEYISSSGLRFFMQLKKCSEQQGGEIIVCNMNEDVEEIFHLSGFHHIFNIDNE